MRHTPFGLARSGLGIGILVVTFCFQMLPFLILMVVITHALGVSDGKLLAIIPAFFFVLVFSACWLASKRTQRVPTWPPPRMRRTANRPLRGQDVLLKTRAERYHDLKDVLGSIWR